MGQGPVGGPGRRGGGWQHPKQAPHGWVTLQSHPFGQQWVHVLGFSPFSPLFLQGVA